MYIIVDMKRAINVVLLKSGIAQELGAHKVNKLSPSQDRHQGMGLFFPNVGYGSCG